MLLDEDYQPSADLVDLLTTLSAELSSGEGLSTTQKDVVVKSEVIDTVLQHGALHLSISLLFFDYGLTRSKMGTPQITARMLSSSRK